MPFNIDQKKWDNFWYYYKVHVIVGIFGLFLIVITVRDCMQNVMPDVSFIYMGVLQPEQVEQIEQALIELVQDANNDGKTHILIAPMLDIRKLQVLLMIRDAQLVLLDRTTFENYASYGAFHPLDDYIARYNLTFADHPEIRITPRDMQEEHMYGIPIVENRFFTDLGVATEEKYLAMVPPGIKPNPKETIMYANAHAILDKILSYAR